MDLGLARLAIRAAWEAQTRLHGLQAQDGKHVLAVQREPAPLHGPNDEAQPTVEQFIQLLIDMAFAVTNHDGFRKACHSRFRRNP
jgi:hypothetical protein